MGEENSGGEPSEHGVRAKITYAIRQGARPDIPTIKGCDVQGADDRYHGEPVNVTNYGRGVGEASFHGSEVNRHAEVTQNTGKVRGKGEDK